MTPAEEARWQRRLAARRLHACDADMILSLPDDCDAPIYRSIVSGLRSLCRKHWQLYKDLQPMP